MLLPGEARSGSGEGMETVIKFGTDGWRGIIAADFTFENVLLVAEAVRLYLRTEAGGSGKTGGEAADGGAASGSRQPLIGYDTRFLADDFARAAASHLAGAGMKVAVAAEAVPTPAIAFAVRHYGAQGAIQFTASHNPYYYCGFKFIPDFAGPAMPETTDAITGNIRALKSGGWRPDAISREWRGGKFDIKNDYFAQLDRLVDAGKMKEAGLRALYNPLWATGSGWLDAYLIERGVAVDVMNGSRDVLFGGSMPGPALPILLPEQERMRAGGYSIGLATDGDSDRFSAFDQRGNYYTANQLIPLIADYLIEKKKLKGALVRTVVTSSLLDRIARVQARELVETKVGFKYVGQELRGGALCGGEESGGFSMAGHVPEKDGILACLLACEIAAVEGGGALSPCFDKLYEKYGPCATKRNDYHLTPEGKEAVLEQSAALADHYRGRGGGLWDMPVQKVVTLDGFKFVLSEDRSIAIRASGTEPVIRVYMEARSEDELAEIEEKSARFIETTGGE